MSLTIKAFLLNRWGGDPLEIRRFTVDQDVTTSFTYLVQKIAQVFPSLRADDITVAWIDDDGDHIVISTDEELVDALDQFDGSVFRLYLKKREATTAPQCAGLFTFARPPCSEQQPTAMEGEEEGKDRERQGEAGHTGGDTQQEQPQRPQPQPQQPGVFHPGVVCDGCSGAIYGTRYKCLVCRDYDLCSSCEGKGTHVEHNMVSITDPHSYNPWGFPFPFGRGGWCGRGQSGCGRWSHPWVGHGHPHHHHHHHHPRHHHPSHPPHFWGGAAPGSCPRGDWWRQWGGGDVPSGSQEPMDTEHQPKEGADGEQAKLQEEQRKTFLRGIGEAVSSFLEPFGVKVDVDVVGGETPKPDATPSSQGEENTSTTAPPEVPSGATVNTAYPQAYPTLDPASSSQTSGASPWSRQGDSAAATPEQEDAIQQVVTQLKGMGFDDEGGWLTELVKAKGGDIGRVLDALHPST